MDVADIREGFLCPMCMKDLGSDNQLQDHFEKAHTSSEFERGVLDNLRGLFDKAKKKLVKKDCQIAGGVSDLESGGSSSASLRHIVSNKDLTAWASAWEAQELGHTKSWTETLQSMRGAHLNYFQSETTKLLLRLEKLLGPDVPTDPYQRKVYERTVVPWAPDSDVTLCTTCGQSFTLVIRRRHHCRLCGCVMCNRCSHFLTVSHAKKLVYSAHEGGEDIIVTPGGFRRSTSNTSLNSILSPEGDVHFRTCGECRSLLERRERTVTERREKPVITLLYEKMRTHMADIDANIPQYQAIVRSLRNGESQHSVQDAVKMRMELTKLYDTVELLSKRISTLGTDDEEAPPPPIAVLQLQKMVRVSTSIFLQRHHVASLENPPTEEEVMQAREERQREAQRRIEAERAATRKKSAEDAASSGGVYVNHLTSAAREDGNDDPMVQQMNNIRAYVQQARAAHKWDEVEMLEANLRELEEYWRSTH